MLFVCENCYSIFPCGNGIGNKWTWHHNDTWIIENKFKWKKHWPSSYIVDRNITVTIQKFSIRLSAHGLENVAGSVTCGLCMEHEWKTSFIYERRFYQEENIWRVEDCLAIS